MICYLCGDFIRQNPDESGTVCETCSMHYCFRCSAELEHCYVCGSSTSKIETKKVSVFEPEDILAEIDNEDKRDQPRKKIKIECAYKFEDDSGINYKDRGHKALTKNISKSGLCIYSLTPLEKGQRLKFSECKALSDRASATVKWVKKTNGKIYIAGLQFE
ncbi:MAG: PilZ domain-containing protein [Nitrospirota bacterium]|nr:MAG: PilZ domain-containing protein [Nitrospirota bacterium]